VARALLGLPLNDIPEYVRYLDSRRRANGSFSSTPSDAGGDGNVINTWYGLQALQLLGRAEEKKEETINWLRACQLPGGGFTHQPQPQFATVDDVAYTWAAVRALALLGATPANPRAVLAYVASLANADGGFADKPGWLSNPLATYYALDTLAALGQLDSFSVKPPRTRPVKTALPRGLKVFSIQIEAHGEGSPADAVELARSLRIHLWGAKNAAPEWLARAQAIADARKVAVKFSVANEEYGTWVDVPGLGTYSHTSDIIAPAGCDYGPSLANRGVVSWPKFREQRLGPLEKAGGRLIWQFGENEELVRLYLDDSAQRGGYAAISTFHFGNPDFTNTEPFLQRYRGRIPFIALQDAHGKEPWWFANMTTGFRTVFLAAEPTWEGWLKALESNWVVAVRHDAASGFKTWTHGGSDEVLDFVRRHELDWRWWDNPTISRPMLSLVALTPEDKFEAGRPEQGIALRVRCAYENTAQGAPTKPLAELTQIIVDGADVHPEKSGERNDPYHIFHVPETKPGMHTAMAAVRALSTGRSSRQAIEF
jgi:hypothetical protein